MVNICEERVKLILEIFVKWMNLDKWLSKRRNELQRYIDNEYILTEWLKKLRSWLWAKIEGLEYIINNAVIKNSENTITK